MTVRKPPDSQSRIVESGRQHSQSSPRNQGEKIDSGRRRLLAFLGALARKPHPDGCQHVPLDRVPGCCPLPEAHRTRRQAEPWS